MDKFHVRFVMIRESKSLQKLVALLNVKHWLKIPDNGPTRNENRVGKGNQIVFFPVSLKSRDYY